MSSFLTKSSTETDNQRAVTQADVLMCELIDIADNCSRHIQQGIQDNVT